MIIRNKEIRDNSSHIGIILGVAIVSLKIDTPVSCVLRDDEELIIDGKNKDVSDFESYVYIYVQQDEQSCC